MNAPLTVAVTAVVLTYNEERNLESCLAGLRGWTREMFVVDSGSTDATLDIAQRSGARVVAHAFETHTRQWRWALANLPITTEWVLALDADQQVTSELQDSIATALAATATPDVAGYFLNRRQVFRGRWIRHGGYYPKYLLKLFRRSAVSLDDGDLVDHHFAVSGPVGKLRGDLIEDNRNEAAIAEWTAKHNRYAVLQARQEVLAAATRPHVPFAAVFAHPDLRTLWLKQQWRRLPLFVRPCLYVFYRYVLRAGFLDGREGFIFHVLQAFWYRLLVDVNISEMRVRDAQSPVDSPVTRAKDRVA